MAIDLYKNRCSVYEGDEPYIFVSYSHQDIEKVVELIRKLSLEGFRVWYDSGVPAGAEWGEEIAAHLKKSKCVLSLLTPNSVESKHFKREFNYADYLEKDILAVYLKECEPSPGLEMLVVSKQCIKRERCENDDDLLEEIAKAQILLPCLAEKPSAKTEFSIPALERFPAEKSPNKQPSAKITRLRAKAEKGDPQAQADLGLAYEKGDGVTQNWDEAASWYRKAAEQGNASAQANLGLLYYNGMGVELDEQEAVKWYQLAADQGLYAAQNNLAVCYEKGEGVDKNISKAMELYRQSAEQGNPPAQENLGLCYEYSKGVTQDWEQAVHWYRKAALQGQLYSQKKLAECYRKGLGVPIDLEESARWQKLYDENPNK